MAQSMQDPGKHFGNGLMKKNVKRKNDQEFDLLSFLPKEANYLLKSMSKAAPNVKKYLNENWRPIVAVSAVLAVGAYLYFHSRGNANSTIEPKAELH